MVYGLIEWEGSVTPTLVIGETEDEVNRGIVRAIRDAQPNIIFMDDGKSNLLHEFPYPSEDCAPGDVTAWLESLREWTTQPYASILDDRLDVVHA